MPPGDALAATLERLPGVVAATVFLDAPSAPRVYLAHMPEADQDTLRDAVVQLLRDHGIECAADRIHLATAPAPARQGQAIRPAILDGLEVRRSGQHAECTVRLRSGTRLTTGAGKEPDTSSGRARAAAQATMRAAEGLDPDLRLGLEGLRVLDLFGHAAVTLVLEVTAGRSQGHLPGTALVERSVEEAAALATLAALRSWTV